MHQTDDKREHSGITGNDKKSVGSDHLKRGRSVGRPQPSMVMTSGGGGSNNLEAGSEIRTIFSDTGGGLCEIRAIFWTPGADFGRLAKTRQIISLSCATV